MFLKDEVGYWVHDQEGIKDMVLSYLRVIYNNDHLSTPLNNNHNTHGYDSLSNNAHLSLKEPFNINVITKALKSFKPSKAFGPNGLHPIFY